MSIHVMTLVWATPLPPTEKLVLLKFADCADDDGSNAFPKIAKVSAACSLTERGAQKIVGRLKADGWLTVEKPPGRYHPTTYRVVVERLRAAAMGEPCSPMAGGERESMGEPSSPIKGEPRSPMTASMGERDDVMGEPGFASWVNGGSPDPSVIHPEDPGPPYSPPASGGTTPIAASLPGMTPPPAPTARRTRKGDRPAPYSLRFMRFYDGYPLHEDKQAAAEVWHRLGLETATEAQLAEVLAGVERYNATRRVREGYIVSPAKWLRNRKWEDAYAVNLAPVTPRAPDPATRRAGDRAAELEAERDLEAMDDARRAPLLGAAAAEIEREYPGYQQRALPPAYADALHLRAVRILIEARRPLAEAAS